MKGRTSFEALACDGVAQTGIWCAGQLNVGNCGMGYRCHVRRQNPEYESDYSYTVLHEASEDMMISKVGGGILNLNVRP